MKGIISYKGRITSLEKYNVVKNNMKPTEKELLDKMIDSLPEKFEGKYIFAHPSKLKELPNDTMYRGLRVVKMLVNPIMNFYISPELPPIK
jgi:hypothetical protein